MMEQQIDQAFATMIATYRCHAKLGMTPAHVRTLRYHLRQGVPISLDKKHRLLKKWGWKPDAKKWNDQDIVDVIQFCIKQGKSSKQLGATYIMEKWLQQGK